MALPMMIPILLLALLVLPRSLAASFPVKMYGNPVLLLNQRIESFAWVGETDFHSLCYELRIPCGYEHVAGEQSPTAAGQYHQVKGKTVREILDGIIRRHPKYRWEIVAGTIVLRPAWNRAPGIEEVVSTFTVVSVIAGDAVERLGLMVASPLTGSSTVGPVFHLGPVQRREISLSLSHANVQTILCEIVYADGRAMWHYYPSDRNQSQSTPHLGIEFYY